MNYYPYPRIVCLIPALPLDIKMETLRSVVNQSVPVACTILLTQRVIDCLPFPAKISKVLNSMVADLKVENFDYILRLDADTILPIDFVEKHVALDVDVVGGAGYAQLIKVKFFIEHMGRVFSSLSDDTYTYFKAYVCGSSSPLIVNVEHRKPGLNHKKLSYQFYTGELDYFVGYDPIHVVSWVRQKDFSLIRLLGYFYCLFTFKSGFEFAKTERSRYLSLIFRRMKL
jgi:hypothetical protein